MNDKTTELLQQLAEKFGTTVEHLWMVLIKQAGITGATDILGALIMCTAFAMAFRFVRAKTRVPERTDSDRYPSAQWEEEGAFAAWMVIGIWAILATVTACGAIQSGATALINPEYWALKQLLPEHAS